MSTTSAATQQRPVRLELQPADERTRIEGDLQILADAGLAFSAYARELRDQLQREKD